MLKEFSKSKEAFDLLHFWASDGFFSDFLTPIHYFVHHNNESYLKIWGAKSKDASLKMEEVKVTSCQKDQYSVQISEKST